MKLRTIVIAIAVLVVALLFWRREPAPSSIRNAPAGAGSIVCFGDSLTAGAGAQSGEGYPEVLGSLLDREILNRGRNGETSESALERLDGDVLAASPSVVIITLGGNDMLRRLPIEDTVRSLRTIFERILASRAMVVFIAVDPPFVSGERMKKVKELCRELGVLYADSVMEGMWDDRKLMSDNIHPNAAGYRLMAERIRDALRGRLSEQPS